MIDFVPFIKQALHAAIVISITTALSGCGGGSGSDGAAPAAVVHDSVAPAAVASVNIVPPDAMFEGQTYAQWSTAFWQWALALPLANPPHPFLDCNNRPISAAQTGNVWFWSAPSLAPDGSPLVCNQSATIIPAGKAIFLTMLDIEASSLDSPPFFAATAVGQLAIAQKFFSRIGDLFCTIDNVPVSNLQNYHALTQQFHFRAPTPWIFNSTGGNGTSVADGYYLMLQLPPGSHTIHYGGTFHLLANDLYPGSAPVNLPMDVTLLVTMGK
ncbi:hypothetical protein WS62_03440 [Burkholderia sp. ABCPW 14]|uniref:hypothetical protein n=1 Tax=Burkholderia sp. ABCPW 14 TaxID=1637860 RepID=UPI000770C6D4|nr:hypothetical protein [Burkholderia sp. ABCPW 14]KVD75793.1 hypothetical protein WS62_03440 [Burkholderia sp. ABCPW 14]